MVVVDSTMVLLLFRPNVRVPNGPDGKPIRAAQERIAGLVDDLEKLGTKIIIPTPVLSEILIGAGVTGSQEIMEEIQSHAVFRIESFDTRAAMELAALGRADLAQPRAKRDAAATYAKLKYDRQIVAIAKVSKATTIYSDDVDLCAVARRVGIKTIGLAELPVPAASQQLPLLLPPHLQVE